MGSVLYIELFIYIEFDHSILYSRHKVLGISEGVHDIGKVKWDIALCLLLAWIVVYLCIIKGVKSSGKVKMEHVPDGSVAMP